MINTIKKILNKIIADPDNYDFKPIVNYLEFCKHKCGQRYGIIYQTSDSKFTIAFYNYKIFVFKDNIVNEIECSDGDYLALVLLARRLTKWYKDKVGYEFIHSLDGNNC